MISSWSDANKTKGWMAIMCPLSTPILVKVLNRGFMLFQTKSKFNTVACALKNWRIMVLINKSPNYQENARTNSIFSKIFRPARLFKREVLTVLVRNLDEFLYWHLQQLKAIELRWVSESILKYQVIKY